MKRSPLFPGLTLAVVVAFAMVAPACGKQGQGERCSRLNGNEDCEVGLTCVDGSILGQTSDLCCPEPLAAATDRRCSPNTGIGGGDGTGGTATTTTTTTTGTGGTGGAATGGGGSGGSGTGGGGAAGAATGGGGGAGGM